MFRILLVEDDDKLRSLIEGNLAKYGFTPLVVKDFGNVKQEVVSLSPDLVLLDVNLPQYDGFYWCRQIRSFSTVPIIFLSARAGEMDQIMAMENGGDDYVTKPFSLDVLVAKVRSVLRRVYGEYAVPAQGGGVWHVAGLTLNEGRLEVHYQEQLLELSPTEFRLLSMLARRAGRVVKRHELLEGLWDNIEFVDENTLNVNIARVRRKLEELGYAGEIITKRGEGYLLSWKDNA